MLQEEVADGEQLVEDEQKANSNNNNDGYVEEEQNVGQTSSKIIPANEVDDNALLDDLENEEEERPNCCRTLLHRNWLLILFGALLGFDLGFWIYLFTGFAQWIPILAALGFIIAVIVDEVMFGKNRTVAEGSKIMFERDSDMEKAFAIEEGCDFYVQTDIFSRFLRRYRGSSRVYRKKDSGSLIFQRKFVFSIKEYQGHEIGAGCMGLLATIVGLILVIFVFLVVSELNFGIVFVVVVGFICLVYICALLGYLLETWLRAANILSPVCGSLLVTTPVPIHEIRDIICVTVGYHVVSTNRVREHLGIYYIFVLYYHFLVFLYRFVGILFQFICINVPFFLWLLVFLFLALLFILTVDKEPPVMLEAIVGGLWAIFFLHIILLKFMHSPLCGKGNDSVKCGNSCVLPKLSEQRIAIETQFKFFYLLLVSCILVFIAAVVVSIVQEENFHGAEEFVDFESSDVLADRITCESSSSSSSSSSRSGNSTSSGSSSSLAKNLCDSPHMEFMIIAVGAMAVVWNILLVVSFWWFQVDNYMLLRRAAAVNAPPKQLWVKYTQVSITRARNRKYQLLAPTVNIELGEEGALELVEYLTRVCPYAQLPTTIGLSYDGGFQYVNRFGDIGGQPFPKESSGNNNGKNRNNGNEYRQFVE